MKNKIIIIITTLLLATSVHAQFKICNSNTSKTLNDVYFFDENIGVAVGDSGVIMRSMDGGDNWTKIMQIDSIKFTKVKFWDKKYGIAIGTKIYTTNNGGLDWVYQNLTNNGTYSDLELFNNFEFIVSNNQGSFFNEGQSYVIKLQLKDEKINVLFENPIDFNITQMSFINNLTGFAHHFDGSETNSILRTIDGGLNWSRLDFETGSDFTLIEDINFISDQIGFMGGWYNAHLMKTTDGGLNWKTVNIENTANTIFDLPNLLDFHIDIVQSDKLYASGWHGEIFKSNDLGSNWVKLESPIPHGISLNGIFFIDDFTGWAVGEYGTIIKTTNGGVLTSTKSTTAKNNIFFPNPFNHYIKIDLPKNEFDKIKLYNLKGEIVKESDQYILEDLETLSTGIYIISIENKNSVKTFSVLKN